MEYPDRVGRRIYRPEMPAAIAKPANAIGMTQNVTYFPELGMSEEAFTSPGQPESGKLPNWKLAAMLPKNSMHISAAWKQVRDILRICRQMNDQQGKDLKLVSTEIYQSVNPFLGDRSPPLVVGVFSWLRRRKKRADHAG